MTKADLAKFAGDRTGRLTTPAAGTADPPGGKRY